MSISLFSVALLLIIAPIAAIEIYRGITRGFFHSLISLATLIPCILISLLLAPVISQQLVSVLFTNVVQPWWVYESYAKSIPSLDIVVPALGQAIISLLLFCILFISIRPLARFVIFCQTVDSLMPKNDDPGYVKQKNSFCQRHSKSMGGIAGGISAIIISMVITCPIMGVLHMADSVITVAEDVEPQLWSMTTLTEKDVKTLKALPDDLVGNLLYELGGEPMFHAMAKTSVHSDTVYLHQELQSLEKVIRALVSSRDILLPYTTITPEHLQQLGLARDGLNELKLCHIVLADYVSSCADYWLDGEHYYYFYKPEVPTIAQPLFDRILEVISTSNHQSIQADLTTLINVYILLQTNNDLLQNHTNPDALLQDPYLAQLMQSLENELSKNIRMQQVDTSSIGMHLLRNYLAAAHLSSVTYTDLTENLANAVNTVTSRGYGSSSEQITVLKSYVQKYFGQLGITLPDLLSDALTRQLLELSAQNDVTGDLVLKILTNNE